jgi:hypothetical protein
MAEESEAFGHSVPNWPAFPDSPGALQYLKYDFRFASMKEMAETHRAALHTGQ